MTHTEGGYCGGEKYPIAAGAFCKWTFCPAPADEGRRLDALPLLTAAVSKAMASVQLENATAASLAELRRAVAKLEAAKALLASKGSRRADDDVARVVGQRSLTDDVVARSKGSHTDDIVARAVDDANADDVRVRREFGKASRTDDVVARGLAIVDDRPVDDKVSRAKRAVRAAADAARGVEAQRRIVADQRRLVAEEKALLASEAKLAAARDLAAAKVDAARAARALALAADARLGGDVM